MTLRVILDTDIGTDVDDCLALGVLMGSPEVRLEAVTCVYGDVALRARMVLKLLALRGRRDVPVYAGVARPLLGRRPVYWAGHEGVGLLDDGDAALRASDEHAVDFIVRHVMANPGAIHLLAIGPLTNVAAAIVREPRLPRTLGHLTIMGGAQRGPDGLAIGYAEHNVKCDPESAYVVLASGAPTTLVPLDVTTRVAVRLADLPAIRAGGTPFHTALADQIACYPPFVKRGYTHLHDPLAAATLVEPDIVVFTDLRVDVETAGEHAAGATLMRAPTVEQPANARVALGVDVALAERRIVERMVGLR